MTFYGRAWVREGSIYTLNTSSKYLEMDTFADWSDKIIDLEIDGDYEHAGEVISNLSYVGGTIVGTGISITVKRTRPGIPRDIEAEVAAFRESASLTFTQLLIGLVTEQWITQAEGTAWLAGTPPAPVTALIAQLPASERFAAFARATRPSEVLRRDPLVVQLGQLQGKTPEELDTFFRTYSLV